MCGTQFLILSSPKPNPTTKNVVCVPTGYKNIRASNGCDERYMEQFRKNLLQGHGVDGAN